MTTFDPIALFALFVAVASAVVSVFAFRESRRANRIALVARQAPIFDAFRTLAHQALIQGPGLQEEVVAAFASHLSGVEKFLPAQLAVDIAAFHQDCERVVWVRTLMQPVDPAYLEQASAAGRRVHQTALGLEQRFLSLIREATDA